MKLFKYCYSGKRKYEIVINKFVFGMIIWYKVVLYKIRGRRVFVVGFISLLL